MHRGPMCCLLDLTTVSVACWVPRAVGGLSLGNWRATARTPALALWLASCWFVSALLLCLCRYHQGSKQEKDLHLFWWHMLPTFSWDSAEPDTHPVLAQARILLIFCLWEVGAVSIFSALKDHPGGENLLFSTFLGSLVSNLQTDKRDSQETTDFTCLANEMKIPDSSQRLFTIFMEKWQDKGKGFWASRGRVVGRAISLGTDGR